jgi:signal transduction histidine kinase
VVAAAGAGYGAHRRRLALIERQDAVREAFARQLVDTQEQERKRIAAGLHDGISQTLIMIKNWAVLGQRPLPEGQAAVARLADIEQAATGALTEVREVVHDLSPSQLETFGIGPTIVELVNQVGDASGIVFTSAIGDLGARLSKDAEINVYRVIQEAINNIVKHSGATRASVEMSRDNECLNVVIADNGRGFDTSAPPRPSGAGGFGILNMSERIRMIGGTASVEASPGHGTKIRLSVPV